MECWDGYYFLLCNSLELLVFFINKNNRSNIKKHKCVINMGKQNAVLVSNSQNFKSFYKATCMQPSSHCFLLKPTIMCCTRGAGRRHHGEQPDGRGRARGAAVVRREGSTARHRGVRRHGQSPRRAHRLPPDGTCYGGRHIRAAGHQLEGQVQQDTRLRHRH